MVSSNNQITTVVDAMPRVFSPIAQSADSYNLYFHIILKINNKSLAIEDRRRLEKYITGLVRSKCSVKAVGITSKQMNLLFAMPQSYALTNFVNELKLLSKNYVRRKLNQPNFKWHEDFEAFTVGQAQISNIRSNIWRQMQFER